MDDCRTLPLLRKLNIPCYIQIYDIVYEMISNGILKEGDTIPGENAMAAYWNVSRSTIRLAVRKLEEDGLIYKMQGKKTTVTGKMERSRRGITQIVHPCLAGCLQPVTGTTSKITFQNGGKLVSDLLGLDRESFIALTVNTSYYVGEEYVASSVAAIPVTEVEKMGISVDDQPAVEHFVLEELYKKARRSELVMSAMEWGEEEDDKPKTPILLVMDEVLSDTDRAISYHKYWMDSNWYRFSLERGR